jgi:hypothetical protein
LLAAIGAPGLLLAVLFGTAGVDAFGSNRSPAFAPAASSLAEAAGNRDAAEVVWRLSSGEDVSAAAPVRIPLKLKGKAVLTPLEAAVLSEWTPMMQLLVEAGALRDGTTLLRLRCMAQRERDRNTILFLATLDGDRPLVCQGVALPEYLRISTAPRGPL